jgi:hypothetical protein
MPIYLQLSLEMDRDWSWSVGSPRLAVPEVDIEEAKSALLYSAGRNL